MLVAHQNQYMPNSLEDKQSLMRPSGFPRSKKPMFKGYIMSFLVLFCLAHNGLSLDGERVPPAHQEISRQHHGSSPSLTKGAPGIREIATSFVTSLFDPFIQDAPKVASYFRQQGKQIKKDGVFSYLWGSGKSMGRKVRENPLDSVIAVGAIALGWTDVAEYSTLVPLTVGVASGVKKGQALWSMGDSISAETFMKKSIKFCTYGLAIYAATSLPVAYATSTVTLGTEFQINQNFLSSGSSTATAGLADGNIVVAWSDNSNNMVARIFIPNNGTAITNEFNMSASVPASQVTPSIAGLTGGSWVASWSDGASILARIFYPNGTAITSPFPVNQVTYTSIGNPVIGSLYNGDFIIGWDGSSVGDYAIPGRIFSSTGTAITPEFNINQITTNIQVAPSLTGLMDGSALATWYSSSSGTYRIYGRTILSNGTFGGSEFTIKQMTSSGLNGGYGASLTNGDAMVAYSNGSYSILGRVIQGGVPIGSEFSVLNLTAQVTAPYVSGLTDGSALVVWGDAPNVTFNVKGRSFDSSGAALTDEFSIPTYSNGIGFSMGSLPNNSAFVSWYGSQASGISYLYGRIVSLSTTGGGSSSSSSPTSSSPSSSLVSSSSLISSSTGMSSTSSSSSGGSPSSSSPASSPTSSPSSSPVSSSSPISSSTGMSSGGSSGESSSSSTGTHTSAASRLTPSGIFTWPFVAVKSVVGIVKWLFQ